MTDREVMQMALDALTIFREWEMGQDYNSNRETVLARAFKAEETLSAALAQGEQEPVAWRIRCTDPMRDWVLMYRHPKAEEQFSNMEIQPLYTAPPQQNEFNPDWDAMAVMVEEQQRMAKRIEELEARWTPEDTAYRPGGLAQGEQEPVAWGFQNTAITGSNRWMYLRETIPAEDQYRGVLWTPLYTAPPQREWQGLTDEDWEEIMNRKSNKTGCEWDAETYDVIEAKLKGKNHGT